jgi:hypothetical protein
MVIQGIKVTFGERARSEIAKDCIAMFHKLRLNRRAPNPTSPERRGLATFQDSPNR